MIAAATRPEWLAIKAASGVARAATGMVVAPATRAAPATAGKSTAKAAAKKK